MKKDLIIGAIPNSKKVMTLKYQVGPYNEFVTINISLNFRSCVRGEITKKITSSNIICSQCPFGFYSLYEYKE